MGRQDEHRHRYAVCLHATIVDHMMKNYEGVLKIEGDVGDKEKYDPRSYMKLGRLPWRTGEARGDRSESVGTTLFGSGH